MQVQAHQIRRTPRHHYELWDGEVLVTVFQSRGAHGFYSAVLVIEYCDAPLETRLWDGYIQMGPGVKKPTEDDMAVWIADQFTELSTGKEFNLGGVGDVVGLFPARSS